MRARSTMPPVAVALLVLAGCGDESNLNAGVPELSIGPASIDFGEVVVGIGKRIGLNVKNDGYGELTFSDVSVDSTSSPDFSVVDFPADGLGHDEAGVLTVQYAPDVEGGDIGTVHVLTNSGYASAADAEQAVPMDVPLEGIGVQPCIDLDPEVLYFGVVDPGSAVTLPVRISAGCSGDLDISHIAFSGGEDVAYSFAFRDDYAEPYTLSNGFSFTMDVTFTPPDTAEYDGEIWIESNDVANPTATVRLVGNTTDTPTENTPPYVQILDPNNGEYFMDDTAAALEGYVGDPDEPATNLLCGWFAGTSRVAEATPDAEGHVTGSALLPVGDVDLTLRCFDSEGASGEDSVVLTVWDADEPTVYTISGGTSIFDYFSVDDDITFTLNGTVIYSDTDHTKDTLAPVEFEARRGDALRITAVDQNYCDLYLDALVLHWGTGESQPLNDAMCDSACDDGACRSGTYSGPWPSEFLDETYTIAIP